MKRTEVVDFVERTAATALEAGLATLVTYQTIDWTVVKVSGVAAGLAAAKFVLKRLKAWRQVKAA